MKKILLLLCLLFVSMNTNADGFFDNTIIGVAFINQNVDIEITTPVSSRTVSDAGSGFGIYLDKYYAKKYRFNGTLSFISYDNFDISQLTFSADYLMPVSSNISFFTGASLGAALQTYSDASTSDGAVGAVYGVQAGAILFISNNLMLEAGYRYRPTSGIETEITSSPGTTTSVDDLSESYFSILLMF
jgi:opacity protein-like surface antigen